MRAELPNGGSSAYGAEVFGQAKPPLAETDHSARDSANSIFSPQVAAEASSKFGSNQTELCIFQQDWWIRFARGSSRYHELRVVDGPDVLGRLPYILLRHGGFLRAQDPHWSHLGGPIVDERLSRKEQAEVVRRLLKKLPKWYSGYFVCNPNQGYADLVRDAFQQAGFEYTVQTTYVRYPSEGAVMSERKGKHRGHLRRASQKLECVEIDAREFGRFFAANLKARGKTSYAPLEIITPLTEEAVQRGQARVIAAKSRELSASDDARTTLYDAAIVYVWDRSHCYYWMSTYRPVTINPAYPKPHPDAIKFLAMRAMEHAQEMNLIFDADGVTTPGSENLYRQMFGLRKEVRRDVFQRVTVLERVVKSIGHKSKQWLAAAS